MVLQAIRRWGVFAYFLGVLLLPALLVAVGVKSRPFEERPLNAFPAFSPARIFDPAFFAQIDKAIADHNPLREPAVKANARLANGLFGDVSGKQLVKGKDGWIFLAETVSAPCIDQRRLESQVQNLAALASYWRGKGKEVLITIAPDKASIFPDKLTGAVKGMSQCAEQNRDALNRIILASGIPYFDAWSAMKSLRTTTTEPVYMKDETHWTEYGSSEFVRDIVARFAPELETGGIKKIGSELKKPDLSRMAGIYAEREFPVVVFDRKFPHDRNSQEIPIGEDARPLVLMTSVSKAPMSSKRVVFVHDSFMYVAWNQVAQYFPTVLYMHWSAFTPERLEYFAEQADVIIIETVEREAYSRLESFFSDPDFSNVIEDGPNDAALAYPEIWPVRSDLD